MCSHFLPVIVCDFFWRPRERGEPDNAYAPPGVGGQLLGTDNSRRADRGDKQVPRGLKRVDVTGPAPLQYLYVTRGQTVRLRSCLGECVDDLRGTLTALSSPHLPIASGNSSPLGRIPLSTAGIVASRRFCDECVKHSTLGLHLLVSGGSFVVISEEVNRRRKPSEPI